MPVFATKERIRTVELPALEKQIKALDADLPSNSEQAAQRLTDLKKDIREVVSLKQSVFTVSRNQSDMERLTSEIRNLEAELAATGSAKTGDDVQRELDVLSNEMCTTRERQALMADRDRQNQLLRTNGSDLHAMENKENSLPNQIRDKDIMEERIVTMTNEIAALHSKLKLSYDKLFVARSECYHPSVSTVLCMLLSACTVFDFF
ncbi:hypothetical protein DFH29DRAFT_1005625 [Suillus ampliporus]|nr:hypothetical protein DFH29DRAFT_1005625 [Suillus ampliporus]